MRLLDLIWNWWHVRRHERMVREADARACEDMTNRFGELNNENAEDAVTFYCIRLRAHFMLIRDGEN